MLPNLLDKRELLLLIKVVTDVVETDIPTSGLGRVLDQKCDCNRSAAARPENLPAFASRPLTARPLVTPQVER